MKPSISLAVIVMILLSSYGCEGVKYGAWEKLGWHKRDLLVDDVEQARDAQADAKEQFTSALERFQSLVEVDGGELEARYDALKSELALSETRAEAVHDRIDDVQNVAEDLFEEWEVELEQYHSAELRRSSEDQLRQTRRRYDEMIRVMRNAEAKMEPVLVALRDHTLYLKHSLNARAIASLRGEAVNLEREVAALVEQMEQAIAEADAFIEQMDSP